MSAAKPSRRWWQFTLRTLLLVTLAVAAWLGYEVHGARTVEQQAQIIRALGGDVEFEALPWSLLRFIEPQTYGRRISVVEVASERLAETLPQLRTLPALREVRMLFEGTSDQYPAWRHLHEALPHAKIVAVGRPTNGADDGTGALPDSNKAARRCGRFLEKIRQADRIDERLISDLTAGTRDFQPSYKFRLHHYQPLRLSDGSLGEVLAISTPERIPRGFGYALVLLVNDRYADARYVLRYAWHGPVAVSVQDVNGDGCPELAVEDWPGRPPTSRLVQALPGDPRPYLGIYAIEPDGFRSLLPKDHFKLEALESGETTTAESGGTTTEEAQNELPPPRPPTR